MADTNIQTITFDERGLIPAVVQDASSGEILLLGFMDNGSLLKTLQTGSIHFVASENGMPPPDSTHSLPHSQPHSLVDVRLNADRNSITVSIAMEAPPEKTRKPVSLLRDFQSAQKAKTSDVAVVDVNSMEFGMALCDLYALIEDRKIGRPEGSYTTYLFNSGLDKILKKIAEESGEVIIAAKNRSPREIVSELADLFYHLMVLMVEREVTLGDIQKELQHRASQAPAKK